MEISALDERRCTLIHRMNGMLSPDQTPQYSALSRAGKGPEVASQFLCRLATRIKGEAVAPASGIDSPGSHSYFGNIAIVNPIASHKPLAG